MRKEIPNNARLALFAPLDQLGRAEAVAARLLDAITLGLLDDAEQLPSEVELAARFGVSTVTVREALAVLRHQGLVETRRGRGGGSFVRTPAWPAPNSWAERLRLVSLADLRDFGDHYLAVAGAAAKLAAERSSPEDLERLRLAGEDLLDATGPAATRAERHFHLEVAAAAQSPRLTNQEVHLQGERGGLLWVPLGGEEGSRRAYAEHRAIITAIAAADGGLARRLTEEHILGELDRLADLHLSLETP
ncbi:FCD domain-containing protein [Amycolatopsis sp. PS_44_ISF1]|uniref:FadR/GntR family transcriptional regulator n=1 Tax=Amycolatopsis sp. PS_44_ISF1 TaxID=2974917 RepID=UPI0028DF3731|nr:FCD domain-containing protein [Amycolatopsis sp. PS_44_ISF1]MDT8909321.1 FCD domain-containing protein [Amycolatopsis sp. PS_44_ISF1]